MAFDPLTAGIEAGQGVLSLLTGVIDRIWPDPAQANAAKLELLKMQQTGDLARLTAATGMVQGQLDTNKAEAASASVFVAGWRPAIGWVCAAALAFQYLGRPIVSAALGASGHVVVIPGLDDSLWQLLLGMLGLGALRTAEKVRGVA
jgi:hypothetical protein